MKSPSLFYLMLPILFSLITLSCSSSQSPEKVLFILPPRDVHLESLDILMNAMIQSGYQVDLASVDTSDVNSQEGSGSLTPNLSISRAKAKHYQMVICAGGTGSFDLYKDEDAHQLIEDFDSMGKWIAALCEAPGILAEAGILEDRRATCVPYRHVINDLTNHGAIHINEPLVTADHIITAKGYDQMENLTEMLLSAMMIGSTN